MVAEKVFHAVPVDQPFPETAHDLQRRYLDEIFRYVSSFVRPAADAEDVVMEIFQAAFLGLHKVKRKDDPRVWLLGIARRKVADTLRRKYRRAEVSLASAHSGLVEHQERMDQILLVQDLLSQLPLDQREALVLKYVNGLSTHEIAVVLGRTDTAANSLLQRAREAFSYKGASLFGKDPEVDLD